MTRRNNGIIHEGDGDIHFQGVMGDYGSFNAQASPPNGDARTQRSSAVTADVGVITILSSETRAVVEMLARGTEYDKASGDDGRRFYAATVGTGKEAVRVVVTQALDPGQRSAMMAFEQLRTYCAPSAVVLCGIAGAIHPDLALGDVVVAREIIYYDMRKESGDGVHRRGQTLRVPPVIQHAVNDMFSEHGEPMQVSVPGTSGDSLTFRTFVGPIGTGDAVIACRKSDIRDFLKRFHDKTLAIETEAGGVAQAFYEQAGGDCSVRGWVAIRGVSDTADEAKGDSFHAIASTNAAAVLERLIPYLKLAR